MSAIAKSDFEHVRRLVREHAAIVLEEDKQYLVEARLMALAYKEGLGSAEHLIGRLRRQPTQELLRKVIEAMTTNETMFFRDVHPFEALRKHILPDLIARRADRRALHIWCGASSTGQEPYSLLMTLREHFPALSGWAVHLLATDLSTEVLERAAQGCYTQMEVSRGLPQPLLEKYFDKQGSSWQIQRELRAAVSFQQLNLSRSWPSMPQMDLIFLRNVLIYFDLPTKRDILTRARKQLGPDGYLLVGSAETTLNIDEGFVPVMYDKTVCYRPRAK